MSLRKIPKCPYISHRKEYLVKTAEGKRTLHLGCADALHIHEDLNLDQFLHARLQRVSKSLVGVDFASDAIDKLKLLMPECEFIHADVERLDLAPTPPFDVVIAGELIEHLNNPGLFLECAKRHLSDDGVLVISTPNLMAFKVFMNGFRGVQHIHPDHSIGFTFSLLETLLERHDLVIEKWFCSFETTGSKLNRLLNRILTPCVRVFPHLADTLVISARKRTKLKS